MKQQQSSKVERKLSANTKRIIAEIKKSGSIKIGSSRQLNHKIARSLTETGLFEYNSEYDGLILTEKGNAIEL